MTFSRVISANEFNIPESVRHHLEADGRLLVPEGYADFVIYGPYWPMKAGYYVVRPQIVEAAGEDLGVLEICDRGVVLAEMPLTQASVLSVALPAVTGLEIRIRSSGVPFELRGILLVHKTDDISTTAAGGKSLFHQLERAEAWIDALRTPSTAQFSSLSEDMETVFHPTGGFDELAGCLHAGRGGEGVAALAHHLDFEAPFRDWLAHLPIPRVTDAWGPHLVKNGDVLMDKGFNLAALRLLNTDTPGVSAFLAERGGATAEAALLADEPDHEYDQTDGVPLMAELHRVQGGFMKLAALTGEATIFCPFTGQRLSSRHCLPVPFDDSKQVFLFYRFESLVTFYIVVAGFAGSRLFLYCPEKDVFLRLGPPTFEWGEAEACIRRFYQVLLPRTAQVAAYLAGPTRPAVLAGTMNNLGHFFWNEVSGVDEYAKKGYLRNIDEAVAYRYAFMDPFGVVPQAVLPNRRACHSSDALCDAVLDDHLFCIRPCGAVISRDLAIEIKALAERGTSDLQKQALATARRSDFVLWAALRAHNKVWVNQVEGILAAARTLSETFPHSAIYIDGTADCVHLYEQIAANVPANVAVIDGTQVTISDTVAWSFAVDAYIATIGSGLVSVTWLAAKPGIAHSETHHLHQMAFWNDVRPDAIPPLAPQMAEVHDLGTGGYCDYEIAPETIVRLLKRILSAR